MLGPELDVPDGTVRQSQGRWATTLRERVTFHRGLVQPEAHVHRPEHGARGRQVLAGSSAVTHATVDLAQTEMAARHEGTHSELIGEGERLSILLGCLADGR